MHTLVLDVETTGFPKPIGTSLYRQPRIIELAWIHWVVESESNHKVISSRNYLINPGIPIPEEITKLTGITNHMVINSKSFSEIVLEFQDYFNDAEMIIGHNIAFDLSCLSFELERIGLSFNQKKVFCTMEATEHLYGQRLTLEKTYNHFLKKKMPYSHRALNDAENTQKIAEFLIGEFK